MSPIRILLVDDSVVIRKLLTETLSGEAGLEVVGTASDGRIGLAKLSQLKPDLVTLDIEMPAMNGLETLAAIRKLHPKLPVIMFSTLTEHGAAATLEALSLGASDYATKPSNTGNFATALERIRAELIPKIKALRCRRGENSCICGHDSSGFEDAAAHQLTNRDRGHRHFDRGSQCVGRSIATHPAGFSRADRDSAAHAANFHSIAGGAFRQPVSDSH
jgi:chemotaxis response regulator CheB